MQKSHRFRAASMLSLATLGVASQAFGSAGVTLPLNQYQAGTEVVNNTIVTNGNFEQPVSPGSDPAGWTATNSGGLTPAMSVGAPDPANLPNPPSVLGSQVAKAGVTNATTNDQYEQSVTLQPNTEYVLSAYMWNYALDNTGFVGDLIGAELVSNIDLSVTAGLFIEPNLKTGGTGTGTGGAFVYKTFNSSMFPEGATLQLRSDMQTDNTGTRPQVVGQWDNVAITPLNEFRSQVYNAGASGNWGDATKWRNGPVTQRSGIATFANQAGAVTVTMDAFYTAGTIMFDSVGSYTIAGTNGLELQQEENPFAVNAVVLRGNHTISAPLFIGETDQFASPTQQNRLFRADIAADSSLTVTSNIASFGSKKFNFEKLGPGAMDVKALRVKDLIITDGTLGLLAAAAPDPVIRAESLTLSDAGNLNLRRGLAVVDYAANGTSPMAGLKARVVSGDIFAGSAAGNLVVAIAEGSSFATQNVFGEAIDATSVVLISTLKGDVNIDRLVNFDDLLALSQNYGTTSGATYAQGDTDYNGTVDFGDLLSLSQNYGGTAISDSSQLSAAFMADWALAQSLVPEPGTLLVACAPVALLRRRR